MLKQTLSAVALRAVLVGSLLGLAGAPAGCTAGGKGGAAESAGNISTLADWMTGSFSSAKQSADDPDYFDIRLHMARIWPERTDGPWLYVEQARADSLDKPYRQRVYRLSRTGDNEFRSDVYELPAPPLRFAGAWADPARFASLTPDMLALRDGCAVFLQFHQCSSMFAGETRGTGCTTTRTGSDIAYITSEVTITRYGIVSWDRGFNAEARQVMGAEKGGYIFVKDGATTTANR